MAMEKSQKQKFKNFINSKIKLEAIAKVVIISSFTLLLGIYPIINWIPVSSFSGTDIRENHNKIMKKQQEESFDYCITQDRMDNIVIAASSDNDLRK